MDGDNLKQGLEGISKIDNVSDFLFGALYWIAVIFILLLVAYIFSVINCRLNRKRTGRNKKDDDNFLDD